ncbi:hypothetical protein GBAR_LOCUS1447 [Geodia barretti]|nr:hypothetical protein GBAR_LOCUS1447 [Geodia barretti]
MAGCCFAQFQAPAQAFLRPGVWLPGVKRLHEYEEEWKISASVDQCMEAFQAAVESLSEAEHLDLRKVSKEKNFIQVFAFTASCNWLDIVEVHFHAGSEPSVTTARARSFSSGFLPACCPLAFFWNVLLFWVPFSGNGFNTKRIKLLRETMQQLSVEVTSKKTCSCVAP